MSLLSGSRGRRAVFGVLLLLLLIVAVYSPQTRPLSWHQASLSSVGETINTDLHDSPNSGAQIEPNDLVLVIKTGATESLNKVPAHLNTTLQSWPHVLLLSDFEEQVDGRQIHDTLSIVSESIRLQDPSFELWRRLRDYGRSGLVSSEPETKEQLQWGPSTSDRQAGWRLARFMNLPMAVKALRTKPEAKWFFFIDADTFISRTNALNLVRRLDFTKPNYAGSQVAMGSGEFFAHGGSGYVLSHSAIVKVVQHYEAGQELWDGLASSNEFGEVPLARALLDLGIPLTWAFPLFQGGNPSEMNFGASEHGRMTWCYPAIAYHHVNSEAIDGLSRLEDLWAQGRSSDRGFRHSDVFREWLLPQLPGNSRSDWDNLSNDLIQGVSSESACQRACQQNTTCVQFTFYEDECRTDGAPKLGRFRAGAKASWDSERVRQVAALWDRQCQQMILV